MDASPDPSADASDDELMRRYVLGDVRAFEALFARLAPRVHGFFLRTFRDPSVADDLLQATFLKVHRARATYRAGEPVRPWVFTVAANVRLDELRRRYRMPAASAEEVDTLLERHSHEEANLPRADPAEAAERSARVHDALARLPEPTRVVIELNRFEGLSFSEIGKALGISAGAAKLRAFRGYEALRGFLSDLAEGGA
jgi:RNA polymerase sigma factor (sigma-70 family)